MNREQKLLAQKEIVDGHLQILTRDDYRVRTARCTLTAHSLKITCDGRVLVDGNWSDIRGLSRVRGGWRVHIDAGTDFLIVTSRMHDHYNIGEPFIQRIGSRTAWLDEPSGLATAPHRKISMPWKAYGFALMSLACSVVPFVVIFTMSGSRSSQIINPWSWLWIVPAIFAGAVVFVSLTAKQLERHKNFHLWEAKPLPDSVKLPGGSNDEIPPVE
jgi:hypothetical protein